MPTPKAGRPVAYLRKSRVTNDRDMSWEVQESKIRQLAAARGDTDLELLSDWGRSGRGDKTRLRTEYRRLRAMIEAGEVSTLYAYSLSRLSRSLSEYADLAESCQRQGVKVLLCKEGEQDYASASGRFTVGILALLAQMEAELAQERARDTVAARRARGDYIGKAGYGRTLRNGQLEADPAGNPQAVLDAYRETGSFSGAARLLNRNSVPTKLDGKAWASNTVARIIRREFPGELTGVKVESRVRVRGSYALARLLRCHCGGTMTGKFNTYFNGRDTTRYISYVCHRGRYDHAHGPYVVSERKLLPWMQAEAGRLVTPERVQVAEQNHEQRAALQGQRDRVGWAMVDGMIDREQARVKVAEIEAELEALDERERIVAVPTIDWSWQPSDLNAVLRGVWEYVELDTTMKPVRAEWRVPEWRAA